MSTNLLTLVGEKGRTTYQLYGVERSGFSAKEYIYRWDGLAHNVGFREIMGYRRLLFRVGPHGIGRNDTI